MSLLKARGGGVQIRVGGNTQETATMVASLPNGTILRKGPVGTSINSVCHSMHYYNIASLCFTDRDANPSFDYQLRSIVHDEQYQLPP